MRWILGKWNVKLLHIWCVKKIRAVPKLGCLKINIDGVNIMQIALIKLIGFISLFAKNCESIKSIETFANSLNCMKMPPIFDHRFILFVPNKLIINNINEKKYKGLAIVNHVLSEVLEIKYINKRAKKTL